MAPHNCYRCKGEDKRISIAVETEKEWKALSKVISNPLLNQDKRLSSATNRQKNREALDNIIEQWTTNFTHYDLMGILQQLEVAAMPCFNAEELYYNTHLKQRECWMKVQHPVAGDKMAISPPWKLSTTPAHISSPTPMFGQHSEYVFRESLGISQQEIESLIEYEVIY